MTLESPRHRRNKKPAERFSRQRAKTLRVLIDLDRHPRRRASRVVMMAVMQVRLHKHFQHTSYKPAGSTESAALDINSFHRSNLKFKS
jgi:hypothetical protein